MHKQAVPIWVEWKLKKRTIEGSRTQVNFFDTQKSTFRFQPDFLPGQLDDRVVLVRLDGVQVRLLLKILQKCHAFPQNKYIFFNLPVAREVVISCYELTGTSAPPSSSAGRRRRRRSRNVHGGDARPRGAQGCGSLLVWRKNKYDFRHKYQWRRWKMQEDEDKTGDANIQGKKTNLKTYPRKKKWRSRRRRTKPRNRSDPQHSDLEKRIKNITFFSQTIRGESTENFFILFLFQTTATLGSPRPPPHFFL